MSRKARHRGESFVYEAANDTLLASGSLVFASGDNSTTEKKTSAISLLGQPLPTDGRCLLIVERPDDATAANLTFKTYIVCTLDGTNARDVLVDTQTVENVGSGVGVEAFVINFGLGSADGTIKFGALFAGDGGAITVYYKLFGL
uniref:Uncharacterized protein n=1 Tax=viral metagenome TaxID=1070528 RepID=A0A6M3IXY9_9ZZZZ